MAAGVGPLSPLGRPSLPVILAVVVAAGAMVAVVYFLGTYEPAAEAFDLIG
ncbi:MAG: hypothetical protein ACYDHB_13730 [Candidatus Dormibacteria bacterium]